MARSAAMIAALFCRASPIRDCRLTGVFCPKAARAQRIYRQILLIFVILPRTVEDEVNRRHNGVLALLCATKKSDSKDADAFRRAFRRGPECAGGGSKSSDGAKERELRPAS